jgi:3-deoxy-D-manno-octulosonic-acid transferase
MALRPIVSGVEAHTPQTQCVTYWSPEAHRIASNVYPNASVSRAPLPITPLVSRFVRDHNIDACVLEYLELYPGWVNTMTHQNKRIGVVNGRVTHRSLRIKKLLRASAGKLDFFWAQSPRDAEYAEALGVHPGVIEVMGSTKYDRLLHHRVPCSKALHLSLGEFSVVVGSLHPDEEQSLCEALRGFKGRVLIAPRYLKRVKGLLRRLQQDHDHVCLRSASNPKAAQFVILDSIGELHAAYGLAKVAIIGGTFGKRNGQNLLEPISMGSSVIFGLQTDKIFDQVDALVRLGVKPVSNFDQAIKIVAHQDFAQCSINALRQTFPPCATRIVTRLLQGG